MEGEDASVVDRVKKKQKCVMLYFTKSHDTHTQFAMSFQFSPSHEAPTIVII